MPLKTTSIAQARLRNQWISAPQRGRAADVVGHMVAVQAQDYAGSKWGLGLRLRGSTESTIERAFNEGRILRTHVLRPTWHFVLPQDIRWLLALTGGRVQAQSAGEYRRAGLDAAVFSRCHSVLQKALEGGRHLTRDELRQSLAAAGIRLEQQLALPLVLGHAELEGLICSGARRGKQFTFALLDERAPARRKRSREELLAELARRYILSRAPATAHDLAKWSGLTLGDCRAGLAAVRPELHKETVDGQEYWTHGSAAGRKGGARTAHLLSVFDEYLSSYRGHTAIAPAEISTRLRALGNALTGVIVLDGMVVGTWKRTLTREAARITLDAFGKFTSVQRTAIRAAARRYAEFHGLRAIVS